MRVVLVLPPLTQLNTPYPSVLYLARSLRAAGVEVELRDLGVELVHRLFSREGLSALFDRLADAEELPEPAWEALAWRGRHEEVVGPVLRFLAGGERTLARRIVAGGLLPPGPRLAAATAEGFGPLAVDDLARRLATLYLEDLADLVTATVDEGFALARYQHHLATGPVSFDPLWRRLAQTSLVDELLDELSDTLLTPTLGEPVTSRPDSSPANRLVVGLSAPFPGNVYGALRIGRRLRTHGAFVLLGGGWVNTELREVHDDRLWDCVDAVCLDDGEGPLLEWLRHLGHPALPAGPDARHRSLTRAGPLVRPHADTPAAFAADYRGLALSPYLQLVDSLNPAHRLWGDGRWNKLTVAHGCYWKKCSFCDIQLDYIARYAPSRTEALLDAMEEQVAVTGERGFHLVDEAAPPRGVRDLALGLLQRGLPATWWGNIRFEAAWTPDLARLCAAAGLVAVTGGLEVASDRLLGVMDKGVTVAQVVHAAAAFRRAGVLVHAYLMYGFPTQTEQEVVDALELVRQLFAAGLLSSAFWHRFVLTRHSGMARDPARYGLTVLPEPPGVFARNDLAHLDPTGADPDPFDDLLPAHLHRWMLGQDLHTPVHPPGLPAPTVPAGFVASLVAAPPAVRPDGRLVWIGGAVAEAPAGLVLFGPEGATRVRARSAVRRWLAEVLDAARPDGPPLRRDEAIARFPGDFDQFVGWEQVRAAGLLVV